MATTLQKTLASTLLAAAAFAGTAEAQTRGEDASESRERIAGCYAVGQEKGVQRLPLTNKALQQDRSSRLLGCVYNAAAGEELIVSAAYDLADPKQAAKYGTESAKLQRAESKEAQKLAKQGGREEEDTNIIRDGAKETKDTIKDARGVVKESKGIVNEVKSIRKGLEGFGLKF